MKSIKNSHSKKKSNIIMEEESKKYLLREKNKEFWTKFKDYAKYLHAVIFMFSGLQMLILHKGILNQLIEK